VSGHGNMSTQGHVTSRAADRKLDAACIVSFASMEGLCEWPDPTRPHDAILCDRRADEATPYHAMGI